MINTIFGCLMLSSGVPVLLLVAALTLSITSWIDRCVLHCISLSGMLGCSPSLKFTHHTASLLHSDPDASSLASKCWISTTLHSRNINGCDAKQALPSTIVPTSTKLLWQAEPERPRISPLCSLGAYADRLLDLLGTRLFGANCY